MRQSAQKFDDSLEYKLVKVVTKFRTQVYNQLKPLDMTTEQWVVLSCLRDGAGLSQKELGEKIHKDPANTTRILDKVEKKGWVRRVLAPDDRRSFLVYLTKEGTEAVETAYPLVGDVRHWLEEGLTSDEVRTLRTLLDKMTRNTG